MWEGNGDGGVGTYPIGNGATHRGDHGNATSVTEANHLLGHCLGSHEYTSDIHFEHGVAVLGRVLQSTCFLLDTGGGHQTIHAAFGVGDGFDDAVQQFCVTHINAAVVQLGAELLGTLLNKCEFRGLYFESLLVYSKGRAEDCNIKHTGSSRRSRA